jgi:hypothetical protein
MHYQFLNNKLLYVTEKLWLLSQQKLLETYKFYV